MICRYQTLLQRKINIDKKNQRVDYIDFEFPFSIFKTKQFKDSNEINQDLIRQGIKLFFYRGRVFDRDDNKNQSFTKTTFKCKNRQCEAKLVYIKKITEEFFEPIIFNNLHRHKKLKDKQKAKRQQITNFILQLRGQQYEEFRKIPKWVQKFDINSQQGLYIVEQVYWINNTEDEILTALSFKNITIRRLTEGQQTLLIFVQTQKMKENYLKYGQTLTLELYHQKDRKRPIHKNHAIGYLFGQDFNMRLVLLGVFIVTRENAGVFKKLFEFFFETTCKEIMPNCIITNQNQDLSQALLLLKKQKNYQYFHLHPWYHLIQRFKQKLRTYQNGKLIMDLMCRSMQQTNENTYYKLMCLLKAQLKNEPQLFNYFEKNKQKYCLRRIPIKFIGFSISTKFGQKVLGQINNSAIYRAHSGRLFHRLLKIQRNLQQTAEKVYRINVGIIKNYPLQINQLYDKLQTNIIQIIIQLYIQSTEHKKQTQNQITINIIDNKNNKSYKCIFNIEYDHWQCQCKQLMLTGLPCSHLICLLMDNKIRGSLLYYINTRWISMRKDKQNGYSRGPFTSHQKRWH